MFVCCIFITSPLGLASGPRSYLKILDVYPFDYTAFVVSGNVWIPLTGKTTPLGGCRYSN